MQNLTQPCMGDSLSFSRRTKATTVHSEFMGFLQLSKQPLFAASCVNNRFCGNEIKRKKMLRIESCGIICIKFIYFYVTVFANIIGISGNPCVN